MQPKQLAVALAAIGFQTAAMAQTAAATTAAGDDTTTVKRLGLVEVTGWSTSSLPSQIPTTTESATRADIERSVNATDSEDALKYFPSLLVRKRYIGDYNHAVLSTRASGTGNSARSAVYADGILLSNFLGNGVGGLSFPPRWGLVTPEEIERVDVMYGPFSAAYPGNSVGAVVDYVTRMPSAFTAHAKVGVVVQPFELYQTKRTFRTTQASASVGNKAGALAWWLNLNTSDSEGQPLTFATRLASVGTAGNAGTPVTGAVPNANNAAQPWFVLGTGTQYHSVQDHLKLKLAYAFSPELRASYVFGLWRNRAEGKSESYLRDAGGATVTSGPINIGGIGFTGAQALAGGDFALTREDLLHTMHGLSLKQRGTVWDVELAASRYDYRRDDKRQNGANNPQPGAASGGPGTLADGSGTGWTTLALKATWRPAGNDDAHVVDLGLQQDRYVLRYRTSAITGNYREDDPGAMTANVRGRTQLQSVYAQDRWQLGADWRAVLGLRAERWEASEGRTDFSATNGVDQPARRETHLSPKAVVAWQVRPETVLKASLGRAYRMPTVAELYGATSTTNSQFINDPNLAPERSWTGELSAEHEFASGNARVTLFAEDTRDALYSQLTFDPTANRNVSRVQNIGRIATSGVEIAATGRNVAKGLNVKGVDVQASLTYADSKIKENAGFVAVAGDTIGRWQPNIPRWRATALATWRIDERFTASLAARYSGRQYRTLNNADINGFTYQGVSKYAVVDARLLWRITPTWSAAFGIDNLNNYEYWNFHPYPRRSWSAELKFDL